MPTIANPPPSPEMTLLDDRVARIFASEIDFIPHPQFEDEPLDGGRLALPASCAPGAGSAPQSLPAHLRRLCETEMLDQEREAELFREMNRLKCQAIRLRDRLDAASPCQNTVGAIETHLANAETIRNHIIQANMRLVMSIAKKFVSPQHSFDDLLSDGIESLMHAVEKFDFDRGFRFSTYAYRCIARNAYRRISLAQKEAATLVRETEDWTLEIEDTRETSNIRDRVWSNLRELTASLLSQLDRRERFIIRSRYALGSHRKVRTFQCLADKLGVSKERVRQLEQRAVSKLRAMAAERDVDEHLVAVFAREQSGC